MFVDTHSHIYLPEFKDDVSDVIIRARQNNVGVLLLPNIDSKSIKPMLNLCKKNDGVCYPMIGLHPCSVKADYKSELKIMREELEKEKYIGIGEVGIDLYWDKSFYKEQIESFQLQIEWAKEFDLPIIIHNRDSFDEVISIVEKEAGKLKGIFHCFGSSVNDAKRATDIGFKLGIGGVSTFKNAKDLHEVIINFGIEHFVLETDSPYLAPVPYRGKRNESAYIALIAKQIADLKEIPIDTVEEVTTQNAVELFNIKL